jgi:hypothetical protein
METTTGNRRRRFSRVLVVGLATAAVLAPSATAYPDSYNPAFDVRRLDDSASVSRQPRFVIDMQVVVPAATLTKSEVRTSGDSNLRSVAIGLGGAAALTLGLVLAAARVDRLRAAHP